MTTRAPASGALAAAAADRTATTPTPTAGDWTQAPERSNAVALRLIGWIATRLGRRATRVLLHPISAYFLLTAAAPRRNARRYLTRVLGRTPRWHEVYRLMHAFAATVLDRVYFLQGSNHLPAPVVQAPAALENVAKRGEGAFLVGAHVGSFEAVGAAGRDQRGLRVAMLMYPDNAARLNALLEALAPPERRPRLLALGRPGTMLALREWLAGGGLAGMLADRTLPGEGRRSGLVAVDFLGRRASFGDGPFRLAELLRRPVFFMAGIYEGGARYSVLIEPLADFSAPAPDAAAREQRIGQAVADYAARLEALCRRHPYNWFNFHDFWGEDDA